MTYGRVFTENDRFWMFFNTILLILPLPLVMALETPKSCIMRAPSVPSVFFSQFTSFLQINSYIKAVSECQEGNTHA